MLLILLVSVVSWGITKELQDFIASLNTKPVDLAAAMWYFMFYGSKDCIMTPMCKPKYSSSKIIV